MKKQISTSLTDLAPSPLGEVKEDPPGKEGDSLGDDGGKQGKLCRPVLRTQSAR